MWSPALSRRSVLFGTVSALPLLADAVPRFAAKSLDGEKFTNESLKGKVVLLQFWATWCQYCRRDQPAVDRLVDGFKDKGLVVLAVNMGESRKTVKKYLDATPRSCHIVLMEDTNLAALYATRGYPYYVLIDRDGNVAGTQKGAAGEDALRHLLAKSGLTDSTDEQ